MLLKKIIFFFVKILYKLTKNNEVKNNYFRKNGMKIGERTLIYSYILTGDSYLVEIGNDCVISTEVLFVTHDYSIHKVIPGTANLFGKIKIGDNCFIGERATLLYGIELADNTIVAAGSVVTKSFYEPYTIIGGNPAKIISTWEKFGEKSKQYAVNVGSVKDIMERKPEILVRR